MEEVREKIEAGEIDWIDHCGRKTLQTIIQAYELDVIDTSPTEELKSAIKQWLRAKKDTQDLHRNTEEESISIKMDFTREFVYGKDNWRIFCNQLNQYFLLTDIKDEKKKTALLLCKINEEAYDVMEKECAPEEPTSKTFQQLVDIMESKVDPATTPVVLRAQFRARRQKEDETGGEFIAALQKMAIKCDFANKDQAITDQIIEGINNNKLRKDLMKEDTLDAAKATKLVKADEAAELRMLAMNGATHKETINKIN